MARKHLLRFLRQPISAFVAVASDPIEAWSALLARIIQQGLASVA